MGIRYTALLFGEHMQSVLSVLSVTSIGLIGMVGYMADALLTGVRVEAIQLVRVSR